MGVGVVDNVFESLYFVWTYKCLRWKLHMESGPVAGEFLILLMMCLVFCWCDDVFGVLFWCFVGVVYWKESLRLSKCLSDCMGFI